MNNPFEEIYNSIAELSQKIDLLLQVQGKVSVQNEFNLSKQEEAAEILNCCVTTLRTRIKEGRLKKNIHYRLITSAKNRKRYFFNEKALISDRGLI